MKKSQIILERRRIILLNNFLGIPCCRLLSDQICFRLFPTSPTPYAAYASALLCRLELIFLEFEHFMIKTINTISHLSISKIKAYVDLNQKITNTGLSLALN